MKVQQAAVEIIGWLRHRGSAWEEAVTLGPTGKSLYGYSNVIDRNRLTEAINLLDRLDAQREAMLTVLKNRRVRLTNFQSLKSAVETNLRQAALRGTGIRDTEEIGEPEDGTAWPTMAATGEREMEKSPSLSGTKTMRIKVRAVHPRRTNYAPQAVRTTPEALPDSVSNKSI
jgi:hypothetical protein